MKRILLTLACLILLIPVVQASFTFEGIHYSVIDSEHKLVAVINRNVGAPQEFIYQMISMEPPWQTMRFQAEDYAGDVIIPEKINPWGEEYTVTRIAACAFAKCKGLKSVVMPNSVIEIDPGAFDESSVENIIFSENVKLLKGFVYGCNSLKKLDLSNFEAVAFCVPPSLEQLILPNNGIVYDLLFQDNPESYHCKFIFKNDIPPYNMFYVNLEGLPQKSVLYVTESDPSLCMNALFSYFENIIFDPDAEKESGLTETEIANSKVTVEGNTITAPADKKAIIYNTAGTVIAELLPGQSKTLAPGAYIATCGAVSTKILVK